MEEDKGGEGSGGGDTVTIEQLQTQLADAQSQNVSMKSKMDELLGETKQAKAKQKASDDAAALALQEKAKKDGDFEQLFKSSQTQSEGLKTELDSLRTGIANEKRDSAAMKIAVELADGDNAGLLSTFIAPRLKHTDDGVKVLDSNGQLTVSTVEDLKTEFKANARFLSLLKGNQASGGGAPGGKQGSGAPNKVLTRAEFALLVPEKQMEFARSKGKVID